LAPYSSVPGGPCHGRWVTELDLLEIKGRIAVALVESIFRRAGFALTPVAAEAVPRPGRDELLPDFRAVRAAGAPGAPPAPARLVEVRYRPQIAQYVDIELQRGSQSVFAMAARHWPDLLFALVTDHPEPGRSCFQVVDLAGWTVGSPVAAQDLHAHQALDVFRHNVEEHEVLLRRMFVLLTGG
jgi:hypothetical protein